MHEFSLMASVLKNVEDSAKEAGATQITCISLVVGRMTEVLPDAMEFALEALGEGTMAEGCQLQIKLLEPRSRCLACNREYDHDRYHRSCPDCGSLATELIQGRELYIDAIEVEYADQDCPADISA